MAEVDGWRVPRRQGRSRVALLQKPLGMPCECTRSPVCIQCDYGGSQLNGSTPPGVGPFCDNDDQPYLGCTGECYL
jgi:hypothetical protein